LITLSSVTDPYSVSRDINSDLSASFGMKLIMMFRCGSSPNAPNADTHPIDPPTTAAAAAAAADEPAEEEEDGKERPSRVREG